MYLGGAYFYACIPSKLHRVRQLVPGDTATVAALVYGRIGHAASNFTASLEPSCPAEPPVLPEHTVFLSSGSEYF